MELIMSNNTVKVIFNKEDHGSDKIRLSDIELGMKAYESHENNKESSFFKSNLFQNLVASLVIIPIAFIFIKGLQSLSII
jgi:hypothetical protein